MKVFDSQVSHPYVDVVKESLDKASKYESQLTELVLDMEGMSGKMYRHFINNTISSISDARYLEVGCWKGSTLCAAIFNNNITAYAIDDFSTDGGPKEEFNQNVKSCIDASDETLNIDVNFEENDYRKVNYTEIGKYNVFLYDGLHEEHDQYDGVVLPYDNLDDVFILIVDDWNWDGPQKGTKRAIEDLNLEVLYSVEIEGAGCNGYGASDWHNGYFIGVLKKTN